MSLNEHEERIKHVRRLLLAAKAREDEQAKVYLIAQELRAKLEQELHDLTHYSLGL